MGDFPHAVIAAVITTALVVLTFAVTFERWGSELNKQLIWEQSE